MTHMKPMSESEGTFDKEQKSDRSCPKCKKTNVVMKVWNSNDGGFEDEKFTCKEPSCGHVWWVEGPDA